MKFHQIRSATAVLELGTERLVIDPMLSAPGKLPSFRLRGEKRRRNPLVGLPTGTNNWLDKATGVLLTHAHHVDHLDSAGRRWIREHALPTWASALDVPEMQKRGLDARPVEADSFGWRNEVVLVPHGRGVMGWLMGPVTGFYLEAEGEPSVLLTSDAVLTSDLLETIERLAPDVIVAPAGSANFGMGGDILFSLDELVALTRAAPGLVVFNHLEALDHCPTTRAGLRERLEREGFGHKARIPADGETLDLGSHSGTPRTADVRPSELGRPGLRKGLVNLIARVAG
jgi:L-ascorbate metabolism protein UlaG (beta-lactamase superfamily)